MQYIRSSTFNDIDETTFDQHDEVDCESDFFKLKKSSKVLQLDSYLVSHVVDATVYSGSAVPLKRLALKFNTPLPASAIANHKS